VEGEDAKSRISVKFCIFIEMQTILTINFSNLTVTCIQTLFYFVLGQIILWIGRVGCSKNTLVSKIKL